MESKTLAITKIILLSLIALLLTTILIILLVRPKTNLNFFKFQSKSELVYEKDIEEQIKKIKVTTKASSIQIEKSDSNKVSVKYYGDKNDKDLSLTTDNETLDITEATSYFCIGICSYAEHKIVISLPKEIDYELDLNTASGDVYLPDARLSNVKIKTISGDIAAINASNANVESTSGDIEINEVEKLTAKTISGEISANQIKRSCDIKTTSGDVEIVSLEITNNSKIITVSGDVDIENNSGSYVKTETISGEVSVNNNDRYAKSELTIKTTSGDIEVGD